ncbi:MAG TPA: photosynthetic reaction center cytochrome c subunit family protein [Bryobacteraceae bacterium]|nr:photosynthetic reaction center cytochrome c subunit family protein [Bryobacteraceae bacterium]
MPVRPVILSVLCAAAANAQINGPDGALNMQAIAQALGVSCDYCHTAGRGSGAPEPKKDVARQMIAMTRDINARVQQATGNASARVDCVTCHRGVPIPRQLPDILADTLRLKGVDAAIAQYRDLRRRYYGRQAYDFSEETLANLADRLATGRPDDAMALMKLNLEYYPQSARSYAIIGYAYTRKLDDDSAIVYYKKALEIEPDNGVIQGRLASILSSRRQPKPDPQK